MNKTIKRDLCLKILVVVLMLIVSSSIISALGVTPAKKLFNYKEGAGYNYEFTVVNDLESPMRVSVDVSGSLADYVTLNNVLLDFAQGEREKKVTYKINPPKNLLEPGNNDIGFILTELPSDDKTGTFVGARLSLITIARIIFPYPGKYIEANLDIFEGDSGGTVVFVVPVNSLGDDRINDARGTIEIYGPANKVVDIFDTSHVSLEAGQRKELMAIWSAMVEPGDYYAEVVVSYDGKKAQVKKDFIVGGTKIGVRDVSISDFKLGEIAKFEIVLRNLWNDAVDGVYAELQVYDSDGSLIGEFKTPTEDLKARDDKTFLGYWDTAGVENGKYKAKLLVHYGDKTIERIVDTTISPSGIKARMRSTGRAVAISGFNYTFNSAMMIALFVLIIINILWFIYFGRKHKREPDGH
tara:strand:+ start:3093 stop:4325 length:1233 start_codon:yes stop_codon:yes gene_type:complete